MKKYISSIAAALALLSLASCSKDTEGVTQVTYYPVIELDGDTYVSAEAYKPYTDPGFTATMNGEDIKDDVKVSTSMDLANPQPGFYSVSYSAVNADGITVSATRYVLVYAPDDPVSGYYTNDPNSNRDGSLLYGKSFTDIIYAKGDGLYHVADLLAGWYQYRAGYGASYALGGDIRVAADGAVSLVSSYLPGWDDGADEITSGNFDAATSTLTYSIVYAGMTFNVILNKDI